MANTVKVRSKRTVSQEVGRLKVLQKLLFGTFGGVF